MASPPAERIILPALLLNRLKCSLLAGKGRVRTFSIAYCLVQSSIYEAIFNSSVKVKNLGIFVNIKRSNVQSAKALQHRKVYGSFPLPIPLLFQCTILDKTIE
ncbi:hypothetical protein BI308_12335 [Roseofilum reptotaenium AO1-A]|uniref:Uncharacterized protein n=1 Tax=Roseofilum reptotaenium AO1-A TaxID=1925591 RepID=A0A1L9QRD9_9CYAN|nr:hypothetical protein BI308_12335 [Roseofilum reptotaenium AO1-A]